MEIIYAKTQSCNKHHWLLKNKQGEAELEKMPLDIYKTDRDNAKGEIRELLKKTYDLDVIQLNGNEDTKINDTLNILLSQEQSLIEGAYLKHRENDYYIKYDFILKQEDKMTLFFILYKNFDKAIKDYNTKLSLIPKYLYSKDIIRNNFREYEIETKAIYLDIDIFKITDVGDDNFSSKDTEKYFPLYADINKEMEDKPCYSRKCKKCEFRKYCGVPKMCIADLESTPNCWRILDPIIKENQSLDLNTLTGEQIKRLTPRQFARYSAFKNKDGKFVNKEIINNFLEIIKNGYISFDFETYSTMKPFSENYVNYSQIPFSFSMDVIGKNGNVKKHKDYIVDYKKKDFDSLIEYLVKYMPLNLPLVVYFKTFEISRFKEMQELYPEHKETLQIWIDNVVDLYEVFDDGGYYDIKFNNSISLKNVYPVLCDSNKYENLNINHGDDAALKYKEIFNAKDNKNAEVIMSDLMNYNKQDTLAQVEIITKLKEITK